MLQEERYSNIIEYLKTNQTAKLADLAKLNHVSADTVRRDLAVLETYGVLERVRGGAVWRQESLEQHVYNMRMMVHSEEKSRIAPLIESVLEDGKTVAIGSSSTTGEIARFISRAYKRLTVITNDMNIVKILSQKEQFRLIVLGGMLDREENATCGDYCVSELARYNADVGIISVSSVSVDRGLSDFRFNHLDTLRQFINISQKLVVAADSSKFDRASGMTICGIDKVDVLLSDDKLSADRKQIYAEKGIEVITP